MTAAADSIAVEVLLFARYAEVLGRERLALRVPAGATLRDVLAAVRALPGGAALPATPLGARNAVQAGLDEPVAAGDEIAFLPPLAGG